MQGILTLYSLFLATTWRCGIALSSSVVDVVDVVDDDTLVCQLKVLDIQEGDRSNRQEYRCVAEDMGDLTYGVDLPHDIHEFKEELDKGNVYAAIPHGRISHSTSGDRIFIPRAADIKLSKHRPEKTSPFRRRRHSAGTRRLAQRKTGQSTVLVLRVVAKDASTTLSRSELSNRVFGTGGDKVNLVSVYDGCSASKLKFVPATGNNIEDGVGEVTITASVKGMNSFDVDNLVVAAAEQKFGNLEQKYDHVMLCLPSGTGSWVAYAYRNWYRSTYNDKWCGSPTAQAHEIGHNLGLKHSNEGGKAYGDTTGLMGFSYSTDEGPNMCFNGHKHWILGWFSDRSVSVNPATNGAWLGKLATFVDYKSTSQDEYVVIQVTDLYLQYNRKKGINSGTQEKADSVTLTKASTVNDESESLASIRAVGAKTAYNGIVIELCSVQETEILSYVELSIYLKDAQASRCDHTKGLPTPKPSTTPTPKPSSEPTNSPTPRPTPKPSAKPSSRPSKSPTVSIREPSAVPSVFPTRKETELPSLPPSFVSSGYPTLQGSQAPSSFQSAVPTNFSSDSPTVARSHSPSSRPSSSPSSRPSMSPLEDVGRKAGCTSGEVMFDLSIKTDQYPQESEWELSTHDKSFSISGGPYELPSTTYNEEICIPKDGYVFTMNDLYGDGLCCQNGQGSYTATIDGAEVVASGGNFQMSESTEFVTPCNVGSDRITVSIKTDYFGDETSWTLDTLAGKQLMSGGNYTYGAWETDKGTICLESSSCYKFTIRDRWGDGMCCSYGFGEYSIEFAGSIYDQKFLGGYEKVVMVGSSCPAMGTVDTSAVSGGRRHRHKDLRKKEIRDRDFAVAQNQLL